MLENTAQLTEQKVFIKNENKARDVLGDSQKCYYARGQRYENPDCTKNHPDCRIRYHALWEKKLICKLWKLVFWLDLCPVCFVLGLLIEANKNSVHNLLYILKTWLYIQKLLLIHISVPALNAHWAQILFSFFWFCLRLMTVTVLVRF